MSRTGLTAGLLTFLCLCLADGKPDPQPKPRPVPGGPLVEALVTYWKTEGKERGKALQAVEGQLGKSPDKLKDALPAAWARLGPERGRKEIPGKPGVHMNLPFRISDGTEASFWLQLPSGLEREFHPLVLCLHGGGRGNGDASKAHGNFSPCVPPDAILLCPSVPEQVGNAWDAPSNHLYLEELLRHVTRQVPVDPDRVYLCGHSMGGWGTFTFGAHYLDRWAACASFSGGFISVQFETYRNTPLYICHGEQDESACYVGYSRSAAAQMKKLGYEHVYDEFKGGHHPPADRIRKGVAWMLEKARARCPSAVVACRNTARGGGGIVYACASQAWVAVDEAKGELPYTYLSKGEPHGTCVAAERSQPNGRVRASSDGKNLLTLETEGVKAFRILFLDRLVDFSKDLRVQVNSRERHNGPVKPDLQYALDQVEKSGDPGRILWGELSLAE